MKQTNLLLQAREAQGLQATFVARLLLLLVFMPLDFIAMADSVTINSGLYAACVALLVLAYIFCLVLLRRRWRVGAVGVAGVICDLGMLAAGVMIQLQIAAEAGAPAVHVLNSGQTLAGTIFILLNGLALRPRYPLVLSAGSLAALAAMLVVALLDPSTVPSERFLNMVPRPNELSAGMVLMQAGVLVVTGAIMVYITWAARRTIREAVRLEQLNTAMAEAQTEAVIEAKTEALSGLVAGISHEMNNPAGAVASTMDTTTRSVARIRRVLEESEDLQAARESRPLQRALAALEETSSVAREAVERITHTTETLKKFTRLDESERQLVDLHEGIESALELVRPLLGDRVAIVRRFGEVSRVNGNPARLNQLFHTLLENAGESIDGRGTITITITTGHEDGRVQVTIADDGRGMARDQADRLFEVGFSPDAKRIHAGMGLPICRSIVRRHGGTISVTSTPGEGTTFEIDLPAADATSP